MKPIKTEGFTIFEKVFDEPQMQSWREKHQALSEANDGQSWFGNTLELAPELMWPGCLAPYHSYVCRKGDGSVCAIRQRSRALRLHLLKKKKAEGRVSGWHRDRWAHVPFTDAYHRPERHQRHILFAGLNG